MSSWIDPKFQRHVVTVSQDKLNGSVVDHYRGIAAAWHCFWDWCERNDQEGKLSLQERLNKYRALKEQK